MIFLKIGLRCFLKKATKKEVSLIRELLTFVDPSSRFRRWEKIVCFLDEELSFPWGFSFELIPKLEKVGKTVVLKTTDSGKIPVLHFSQFLRPYQEEVLTEFFKDGMGILKLPTGSGKTIISCDAIRLVDEFCESKRHIVFFVDEADLMGQALEKIRDFIGIETNVIGSGRLDFEKDRNVTVATIQTFSSILSSKPRTHSYSFLRGNDGSYKKDRFGKRRKKKTVLSAKERKKHKFSAIKRKLILSWIFKNTILLIVDEIQEFGGENRSMIIHKFKSLKFLLALSATPFKKSSPLNNKRIMGFTGGIIATIEEERLVKEGWLSKVHGLVLTIPDFFQLSSEVRKSLDYTNAYSLLLTNNIFRNEIICDVLHALDKVGLKTIVTCSYKDHAEELSNMSGFKFLTGEDGVEERKKQINKLRRGELNVLIVTKIFNKGTDVSEIDVVFNCGAGKEETTVTQKRGRAARKQEKTPNALFIDTYDDFTPYFRSHSKLRNRVLKKKGPVSYIDVTENKWLYEFERYLKMLFKK